MGCGSSSSTQSPPISMWTRHQQHIQLQNHQTIQTSLMEMDKECLKVGVFGLRGSGKTSLLHAIRRRLTPPEVSPSVPLPPPTESYQFFQGPINGQEVVCIDTPGLPCCSRASLRSLLPQLQRMVWVVDSTTNWDWDLSCHELLDLWSEVQAAGVKHTQQQQSPLNSPEAQPTRKIAFQSTGPALHIIFTKQVASSTTAATISTSTPSTSSVASSSTLGPHEIAAYMNLSLHFPPSSPQPVLHGWNCQWENSKLDELIASVLGPSDQVTSSSVLASSTSSLPSKANINSVGDGLNLQPTRLIQPSSTVDALPTTSSPPTSSITLKFPSSTKLVYPHLDVNLNSSPPDPLRSIH